MNVGAKSVSAKEAWNFDYKPFQIASFKDLKLMSPLATESPPSDRPS